MILIASGHQLAVNLSHQIRGDGPVGGKLADPAVCPHRGVCLPLRTRTQLLGRNIGPNRLLKLSLGELRAFNSAGSSNLAFELQLLERLDPTLLVGKRGERTNSRLGFNQSFHDGVCVIENPAFWLLIANHEIVEFISGFIFSSFTTHILSSTVLSVN